MIPHHFLIFSQGCSFLFLLLASVHYLILGKDRLMRILGWELLYWWVIIIKNLIFIINGEEASFYEVDILFILKSLVIPLAAALLFELVSPKWINLKHISLILSPYIVLLLIFIVYPLRIVLLTTMALSAFYSVITLITMLIAIPRYQTWLKNHYSNTQYLKVRWLWCILFAFLIFFLVWAYTLFQNNVWTEILFQFSICIVWSIVCYFIYKQQQGLNLIIYKEFTEFEPETEDNMQDANKNSINNINSYYGFDAKLQECFGTNKIYLNPTLTLNDLAKELNTNRTYLSYYLNNVLNTTFYDYVNEHRLEHASEMLIEKQLMSIEEIAMTSGFNSLSTFRRSFNKYFGSTPNLYRQNMKIKG